MHRQAYIISASILGLLRLVPKQMDVLVLRQTTNYSSFFALNCDTVNWNLELPQLDALH